MQARTGVQTNRRKQRPLNSAKMRSRLSPSDREHVIGNLLAVMGTFNYSS